MAAWNINKVFEYRWSRRLLGSLATVLVLGAGLGATFQNRTPDLSNLVTQPSATLDEEDAGVHPSRFDRMYDEAPDPLEDMMSSIKGSREIDAMEFSKTWDAQNRPFMSCADAYKNLYKDGSFRTSMETIFEECRQELTDWTPLVNKPAYNRFLDESLEELPSFLADVHAHRDQYGQIATTFVDAVDEIIDLAQGDDDVKALLVNGYVNSAMAYNDDQLNWGNKESRRWFGNFARLMEENSGVCVNTALEKYLMARAVGIPKEKLKIDVVGTLSRGASGFYADGRRVYLSHKEEETHAVLRYNDKFIMDGQSRGPDASLPGDEYEKDQRGAFEYNATMPTVASKYDVEQQNYVLMASMARTDDGPQWTSRTGSFLYLDIPGQGRKTLFVDTGLAVPQSADAPRQELSLENGLQNAGIIPQKASASIGMRVETSPDSGIQRYVPDVNMVGDVSPIAAFGPRVNKLIEKAFLVRGSRHPQTEPRARPEGGRMGGARPVITAHDM